MGIFRDTKVHPICDAALANDKDKQLRKFRDAKVHPEPSYLCNDNDHQANQSANKKDCNGDIEGIGKTGVPPRRYEFKQTANNRVSINCCLYISKSHI